MRAPSRRPGDPTPPRAMLNSSSHIPIFEQNQLYEGDGAPAARFHRNASQISDDEGPSDKQGGMEELESWEHHPDVKQVKAIRLGAAPRHSAL